MRVSFPELYSVCMSVDFAYLLRLDTLLLLLTLLLKLRLRSEPGERALGEGDRSAFAAGEDARLPFAASGSGLDILLKRSQSPFQLVSSAKTYAVTDQE